MNPLDALTEYLDLMQRRLCLDLWTQGFAAVISSALILTLAFAWISAATSSPSALHWCRVLLFLALGITAAGAISFPFLYLDPKVVARALERRFPVFNQSLLTLTERRDNPSAEPFLPLLAGNVLEAAQQTSAETLISRWRMFSTTSIGAASGLALVWIILWGPGAMGNNARALWAGKNPFSIELKGTHKTIRRGSDFAVTARLKGFAGTGASLWIRYSGSSDWKPTPMMPQPGNPAFGFMLTHVPASADYYVEAEGIRSPVARLNVIDLPGVKSIAVTYANQAQLDSSASGGDIVAPAGTVANLTIETDRPMNGGELVLEEADPITLAATHGNKTSASLRVLRDDGYHLSVMYEGEPVQVSDEHAIEVVTHDAAPAHGTSLLNHAHSGPVPAGYEKAVADYYRRLSEQQSAHP